MLDFSKSYGGPFEKKPSYFELEEVLHLCCTLGYNHYWVSSIMVWDRWLKDTHLRGLWTVDGPEALQWPGLGMGLGHGAPPLHVAAMRPSNTKGRTHSRMGPTLSCLSPPPTFSNPFPPLLLSLSHLRAKRPPFPLRTVSGSAAAFGNGASFRKRRIFALPFSSLSFSPCSAALAKRRFSSLFFSLILLLFSYSSLWSIESEALSVLCAHWVRIECIVCIESVACGLYFCFCIKALALNQQNVFVFVNWVHYFWCVSFRCVSLRVTLFVSNQCVFA